MKKLLLFVTLLVVHSSNGQGNIDCNQCTQTGDNIRCTCNVDFTLGNIDQTGVLDISGTVCSNSAVIGGVWEGDMLNDGEVTGEQDYQLFNAFVCNTVIKLRDLSFSDSGAYFCPVVTCGVVSVEAACFNWHNGNECRKAESCESCQQQSQINTNGECVWCPTTSSCLIKGQGLTDRCQICDDVTTECTAAAQNTQNTFDCSSCNNPTVVGETVSCSCNIRVNSFGLQNGRGSLTISSDFCSQSANVGGDFQSNTISQREVTTTDEISLMALGICTLNFQLQEITFSESGMYFCPILRCGSTTLRDSCIAWQGDDACLGTTSCSKCTANSRCAWCPSSSQCLLREGSRDKCGVCPSVDLGTCANSPPAPSGTPGDRLRCHDCKEINNIISCTCTVRIDDFGIRRNGDFLISSSSCSDVGSLTGTYDNIAITATDVSSTSRYSLGSAPLCEMELKFNDLRFTDSGVTFCPEITCGSTSLSDYNCVSWTSSTNRCNGRNSCSECLAPGLNCFWCPTSGQCLQQNDQRNDRCGICPAGRNQLPCVVSTDLSIDCSNCNVPSLSPQDVVSCSCAVTENGKTGTLSFTHRICNHAVRVSGVFDGTAIVEKDISSQTDTALIQDIPSVCSLTLALQSPQFVEGGVSFCPEVTCGGTKRVACVQMEISNPCYDITSCRGCVENDRCIWCGLDSTCLLKKGNYDKCESCGVGVITSNQQCPGTDRPGPTPIPPVANNQALDCSSCNNPSLNSNTGVVSCTCGIKVTAVSTARLGNLVFKSTECSGVFSVGGEFDGNVIPERNVRSGDAIPLDNTFCSTTITFNEVVFSESGVHICSVMTLCDGLAIYTGCVQMQENDSCKDSLSCGDCLTNSRCIWCLSTGRCLIKSIHDGTKDKCSICTGQTQAQQQFCPVGDTPIPAGVRDGCSEGTTFNSCLSIGCLWTSLGVCNAEVSPPVSVAPGASGGNKQDPDIHKQPGFLNPVRDRITGGRTHKESTYDTETDRSIDEQRVSKDNGDYTVVILLGVIGLVFLFILGWWGRRYVTFFFFLETQQESKLLKLYNQKTDCIEQIRKSTLLLKLKDELWKDSNQTHQHPCVWKLKQVQNRMRLRWMLYQWEMYVSLFYVINYCLLLSSIKHSKTGISTQFSNRPTRSKRIH